MNDPPTQNSNVIRPVSSMTVKEIKKEKLNIWKNVIVISVSFMCLFTAYNSVANLQVMSLKKKGDLNTVKDRRPSSCCSSLTSDRIG